MERERESKGRSVSKHSNLEKSSKLQKWILELKVGMLPKYKAPEEHHGKL